MTSHLNTDIFPYEYQWSCHRAETKVNAQVIGLIVCLSVYLSDHLLGFPGGSVIKNLPAMQEHRKHGFSPWVGKSPWRRGMATHSSNLAGESHGQRSLVGYCPWGCKELDMTEAT